VKAQGKHGVLVKFTVPVSVSTRISKWERKKE
jgi:hypothetical protein